MPCRHAKNVVICAVQDADEESYMSELMNELDNKKISFIGGGNMAQALISGLLACGGQDGCGVASG